MIQQFIAISTGFLICIVSSANAQDVRVSETPIVHRAGNSVSNSTLVNYETNSPSPIEMQKIKKIIFEDLGIHRNRSKVLGKSGYNIITVASNEVPFFTDLYKNNVPKVEVCTGKDRIDALIDDNGRDRKTHDQCQMFSVVLIEYRLTGAELTGNIYCGPSAAEFYNYSMTNNNGEWSIARKKFEGAF